MAMDTEASLREYLRLNLRVPIIGRLGPLARALDFVATAAPGVKEILTIGKIMWEVRESIEGRADFDIVVVDAAATGHIVAQLGAADAIQELVDVGPLREQTRWVSELLADPHVTAVNVVTTPEEMPVTETIELVARIHAEVDVPLGAVIVNRVLPELFTHADEETFEALRVPPARDLLDERAGRGAVEVLDGARLAVSLRRTRAVHLDDLRDVGRPAVALRALPVRARSRAARDAHGRRRARRGAGPVKPRRRADDAPTTLEQLLATKEIVVCCGSGGVGKTSVAAAAALGAATRLGGKTLVLTIDPARRLATALGLDGIGNVAHRVPDEALEGGGDRRPGRAVGRDARHEAVVGRPRVAPRQRRRDRGPHPREPPLHQPHRALRAESRLHRDGAPVRDPLVRRVRPHRRRHAADAQRGRLPRSAGAHGRVLRRPAAALAHAAVPRRRQAQNAHDQLREPALLPDGRPRARQQVPARTSPSSS